MALPNLTLRSLTPTVGTTKGSALTFAEMDTNLNNLAGANITVTAAGTTSNIALNSGFTITAGSGVSLTNSAGNVTITSNVAADTSPMLGGNLNVNNKTITGNVFSKGVEVSFSTVDTTSSLKFSSTAGSPAGGTSYGGTNGLAFYCGNNENTSVMITANANTNNEQFKIQNISTGSSSEAKMTLYDAVQSGGQGALALFKPSGNTYSLGVSGSTQFGDGGIYNQGGNLKLYAWDLSANPKHITFQGLFTSTAADEPFDFDLANGDLRTLGNINLAAGKNVYLNGVAVNAYGNTQVTSVLAGNVTVGNIAGKTSGFTLGYLEMPQVASANVTLALADSAKHFYRSTTAPHTITIPLNSNAAFGNGTVISIVNQAVGNITLTPAGGVSLYLGGNSTSAGRTITSYGVATVMKVATDTWFVNGSGVV